MFAFSIRFDQPNTYWVSPKRMPRCDPNHTAVRRNEIRRPATDTMLLYIYLTAQLQHTQIWIPFTGVWGRWFMIPAHHQLDHSADPAHFKCNMGASRAIWDWLVGSLRMPPVKAPRLVLRCLGPDARPAWPHGPGRRPGGQYPRRAHGPASETTGARGMRPLQTLVRPVCHEFNEKRLRWCRFGLTPSTRALSTHCN